MAIEISTPQPGKFGWIINAVSADISGAEELKAAIAGKSIIVDHITINNTGAQTITIGEGITGAAVTTAIIGPIAMPANSSIQWDFPSGIVLTAATNLSCDASSNTAVCIFAFGRVQ